MHHIPSKGSAISLRTASLQLPTRSEWREVKLSEVEFRALDGMCLATMILESQAWKKRSLHERLMSELYLREGPHKEESVGNKLSKLFLKIDEFDFSGLRVELTRVNNDTVVARQELKLPEGHSSSKKGKEDSRTEDDVTGELALEQFLAGELAKYFGEAAELRQFVASFVEHIAPAMCQDLQHLAGRGKFDQITPQLLYFTAFSTQVKNKIFNELSSALRANEETTECSRFYGVIGFVANAIVTSIDIGLALELNRSGVDLTKLMLQAGRMARTRHIQPVHAEKAMEGTVVTLVSNLELLTAEDSCYRRSLAIVSHGQAAMQRLKKIADTLPESAVVDSEYSIFPQSSISLQIANNGEFFPVVAIFDGLVGSLVLTTTDLKISDGSGAFIRGALGGGVFLPDACPVILNSDGSTTCGSGMGGLYTTLPEYTSNQKEALRKIKNFFQAKLLEVWRDFPEVMNLADGIAGISWVIDLAGDAYALMDEGIYRANRKMLDSYESKAVDIEGKTVIAVALREVEPEEAVAVVSKPTEVKLPQVQHFADIVRALSRLGAKVVPGRGSHTGLEYKGRKYTLCKTIRGSDGASANQLLRKVLKFLRISDQEFVDAYNRK